MASGAASPPLSCYFPGLGEGNAAADGFCWRETAERYGDDCGLVSNSADQMTLQWESMSVRESENCVDNSSYKGVIGSAGGL